jgi:hypothetical protein
MKTWLGYLSTRRTAIASSTRNELPVRQRAGPALHGLRAGYAPRIHAMHVVASSQPAQAPLANTLGQLRPWAGRGSGRTSQAVFRLPYVIAMDRSTTVETQIREIATSQYTYHSRIVRPTRHVNSRNACQRATRVRNRRARILPPSSSSRRRNRDNARHGGGLARVARQISFIRTRATCRGGSGASPVTKCSSDLPRADHSPPERRHGQDGPGRESWAAWNWARAMVRFFR